jgi:hypothetical protein
MDVRSLLITYIYTGFIVGIIIDVNNKKCGTKSIFLGKLKIMLIVRGVAMLGSSRHVPIHKQ